MFWLSFVAILVLQGTQASPTPRSARVLKRADHVLDLKRSGIKPDSSKALFGELAADVTTPLKAVESGGGYAVSVGLGGQSFTLIFDTGSSDLWVASQGVECVNAKGKQVATSKCAYGPLWSGNYQEGKVANENFNITYGDGEFLVGTLGYEDVTIASVTVDHQEIAAVTEGYWNGDGVTSGIVGFAYSTLTSAYPGTNPANDNPATNNIHYTNWIGNAIAEKKINPIFSVAIERGAGGGGGQVALGGLPTISFDHTFATTPLEIHSFTPHHPIEASKYTFYTITPEAFVIGGKSVATSFPVIVDTGTVLVYLPAALAREINLAFDPPSVNEGGIWENYCDATPPSVAITIGGTSFKIAASELLLQGALGKDPSTGGCVCGIQPSTGPYILGDVFLKNVVAVFDIGDSKMEFAPHETY